VWRSFFLEEFLDVFFHSLDVLDNSDSSIFDRNLQKKKIHVKKIICTLTYSQFHQCFYTQIFLANVVSTAFFSYMYIEKAAEMTFAQKICM